MKGRDIAILKSSELENQFTIGAEYYSKEFRKNMHFINKSQLLKLNLSQCCLLITDGDHGPSEYTEHGVKYILSEAVREGFIDIDLCKHISIDKHNTLKRSALHPGDVVVTKTGVYFGLSAVIPDEIVEANTIAHVGKISVRDDIINPYYLSTFFNSKYGHSQLRRRGIKATRPEIKLIEFDEIRIPIPSIQFQNAIELQIRKGIATQNSRFESIKNAELSLFHAIGLDTWQSSSPLSYARLASDVQNARRWDAEYYSPRVTELIKILSLGGKMIRTIAEPRHEKFEEDCNNEFNYIEIGNIHSDGTASSECLQTQEAPSRATWHVHTNDIITSMVRPIRRLSAIIQPEQDSFVCSSGFVVLKPDLTPPSMPAESSDSGLIGFPYSRLFCTLQG